MSVETDPEKIKENTRKLGEIRRNSKPKSHEAAVRQIKELARQTKTTAGESRAK